MGVFSPTPYFDSLIDDFGIWQHTDGAVILREEGYALDDAARGLLLTLSFGRTNQSEVLWSYIIKSQTQTGLLGFARSNRHFIPAFASNDANGETIWAAGYALSKGFHKKEATHLLTELIRCLDKMDYMRGYAYALLGAIYINDSIAKSCYVKLQVFFSGIDIDGDWPWPDSVLTYGNGILPYAFLRYALVCSDKKAEVFGRKLLIFLERCCTAGRQRGPIGNDGWLRKGSGVAATYSQQPIDTSYMAWAWLAAYQLSGDASDKRNGEAWMRWYEGDNVASARMYDPKSLSCFDGIDDIGVNYHSGAESNICFLLSKYMLGEGKTI